MDSSFSHRLIPPKCETRVLQAPVCARCHQTVQQELRKQPKPAVTTPLPPPTIPTIAHTHTHTLTHPVSFTQGCHTEHLPLTLSTLQSSGLCSDFCMWTTTIDLPVSGLMLHIVTSTDYITFIITIVVVIE